LIGSTNWPNPDPELNVTTTFLGVTEATGNFSQFAFNGIVGLAPSSPSGGLDLFMTQLV